MNKVVTVKEGRLLGEVTDGVQVFKGVPFAAPPIGSLRWRSPEPALPWNGIRPALTFPAIAPQTPAEPDEFMSEDCLYLNIWAPENAENAPVHVWFYGGALQVGSANDPITIGTEYAKMGIVAVTAAYRVGIMGFMCHPEMEKEDPNGYIGNFGHRDQIAALKWIQENIAAFGGNPDKVTISGQSAGSGSCCTLMNTPSAQGLFHQAICHSGDIFQPERDTPAMEAAKTGVKIMEIYGCKTLDELRKVPFTEFLKKDNLMTQNNIPPMFACTIDGRFLPGPQGETMLNNHCSQIPVIIGSNYDEGSRWAAEAYIPAITARLGIPDDLYSMEKGPNGYATELARDYWYGRMTAWARIRSEKYGLPTWQYVFARRLSEFGAFHGMEMEYTFQTLGAGTRHKLPYTDDDRALSKLMSRYWANFIKTGDPNGEGLPLWETKNNVPDQHMQFDAESGMHSDITRPTDEIVGPATEKWMRSRIN